MVPLSLPTVLTAGLFALLCPPIITCSESMRPVQVALLYFRGGGTQLPLPARGRHPDRASRHHILYFFTQKRFTEGLSAGIEG